MFSLRQYFQTATLTDTHAQSQLNGELNLFVAFLGILFAIHLWEAEPLVWLA